MNRMMKGIAAAAATVVLGFGGLTATTAANAATNDQIATYLTDAVAAQLGLTSTDSLHQLIVDAMANNLIDPTVTDAANAAVDGTSTLTAAELAALLDANLTQQLGTIEQTLIDLGVTPTPPPTVEPPVIVTDDDGDDDATEGPDDDATETDVDSDDVNDDSDDDSSDSDDDDSVSSPTVSIDTPVTPVKGTGHHGDEDED